MSDSAPPPPPPPDSPYGAPGSAYGATAGPQPGTLWPRFAARLIDGIIVAVVGGVVGAILRSIINGYVGSALSAVLGAAIYLGYFVYLETTRGQTVGKMALSLRVVGPDDISKPTLEQSVRRNLWTILGILGVLGSAAYDLGAALSLIAIVVIAVTISSDTVRRQSWFDKLAGGTQVLKD